MNLNVSDKRTGTDGGVTTLSFKNEPHLGKDGKMADAATAIRLACLE